MLFRSSVSRNREDRSFRPSRTAYVIFFVEDVHEVSKGCILADNVEQLEHETKSGITCATYEGGGQRCIERKGEQQFPKGLPS